MEFLKCKACGSVGMVPMDVNLVDEDENEDEDAEELKFEGTIVDILDSIWTMTIDGETMEVDVSGAEVDGEAAPELEAEVKGIVVNDIIIASEVEIQETEKEIDPKYDDGRLDGSWAIGVMPEPQPETRSPSQRLT